MSSNAIWNSTLALVAALGMSACLGLDGDLETTTSGIVEGGDDGDASEEQLDFAPFADIRVATEDGAAEYRFRFASLDGGAVVTLVDSPLGYPAAKVDDECALDTFLRVAEPGAEVPRELLNHCGVPVADGRPRPLLETDAQLVVADLNTSGLSLQYGPVRKKNQCSPSAFEERVQKLRKLASYQPLINANCTQECELYIVWNSNPAAGQIGCAFYNGDEQWQNSCTQADFNAVVALHGASGTRCLSLAPFQCDSIENPECDHGEWAYGDWGPYGVWNRHSVANDITRVHVEVTTCSSSRTKGWWRVKKSANEPWGPKQSTSFGAQSTSTVVLSAGYEDGKWRGWDFEIQAEGNDFHVASAWVELEGRKMLECPLAL